LEDLITLQYSNLHVCITSSLEHDIQTTLEPSLLTLSCRFGWAACQLNTLCCFVPEGISKALDKLPTALYERYMQASEEDP
jgi:hypothetical protein